MMVGDLYRGRNKLNTYTVNHKKTWHLIFDYNFG